MHEKRTAVSIHSAGSSFDDHLNPDHIELRSRTKATSGNNIGGGWRRDDDSPTNPLNGNSSFSSSNRVVVDHQIQPDETLTSIALLYSVQAREIKRANNLVADQDIFGLPSIRIPVSLHQHCNKPSSSSPNSVVPEVKQNWGIT
uniref:LysM domain-containing protein n=1 Tax=Ditylenchus dipsaci TaxID=166011 RepID=A0A915EBN9_9BILA